MIVRKGYSLIKFLYCLQDSLFQVCSSIRPTMMKSTISKPCTITEKTMASINWEVYKEFHRFEEEDFYHVPDLQYYVHKITQCEAQNG